MMDGWVANADARDVSGVDAVWNSMFAPGAQKEWRRAKAAGLHTAAIVYRGRLRLQIDEKNGAALAEEVQPERQQGGRLRIDTI